MQKKNKIKIILAGILALCLLSTGCKKNNIENYEKHTLFLMGTLVEITLPAGSNKEYKELKELMSSLTDTISDDCKRISSSNDLVEISETTYKLLLQEEKYFKLTNGHFNSAVFTVSSLYGFPEGPLSEPDNESLMQAKKAAVKGRLKLITKSNKYYAQAENLKVDLGAFAKGWIVDEGSKYLMQNGINNFIISAGGDLYASGTKAGNEWRLGIADPHKKVAYIDVVKIKDKGLATSGIYERYFITEDGRHISHIFDGVTGEPAKTYISVSVIAETAELADLYSTVYYFMNDKEIEELCQKTNTSALTINFDNIEKTFCGWENFR